MEKNKKDFCTEIISVGYLYDLYKRQRIIFIEKINRNKWNKNRRNNYISCLKKNYPTKPLICFRKIENNFLNYYIYDGYNRIKSIIRYLTKNKNINSQILQKQIVLEIIPEYLTEKELKIILSHI